MVWARMLAYIAGTVDQELLLRNEYLAAENRILKMQIKGRLLLSDGEKATLSEIAYRLGRKALREVAMVAQPETILAWYRRLIAHKFDGSKSRRRPGRPRVRADIESLVVRMAKENPSWGYDRIVGALANLGHQVSDQTVGNILRRYGTSPAPQRKNSVCWKDFIRTHLDVMAATDFLHGRSPDVEGPDHLLRAVLHPLGDAQDLCIGNHAASGPRVDGTAGTSGHLGRVGISGQTQVSVAGSRCEILHLVPAADRNRRAQDDRIAGQESKLERLRRALGAIG
jgi:Homeodomain-like domain